MDAPSGCCYSALSTLTGSTAVAVHAGAKHPAPDTSISTAATMSNGRIVGLHVTQAPARLPTLPQR
ncbi:MAG: hypothetical protein VYA48_04540, partial [Gemmatimonadota bacterium]|nr:hypothetical protein [Gemmatimonadota bacterium]